MAAQQEKQIRHRVASEEKAFHVVLRLLENPISEDYLKDAGQLISPSHYADVVEERSIAKDCGYPLCSNKLSRVPKQQYKICTKSNMVYDITERKKFCSNFCLKASQFFEKQISTSPVWSRELEPKVDFEFLAVKAKRCTVGDEVLLSLPRTDLKKEVMKLEKQDQISSSKQQQAESPKSHTVPTLSQTDDSNIISNIVENMADMTVADVHQVHGINVDFSEPRSEGEAALGKNIVEEEERVSNVEGAKGLNPVSEKGQGESEGVERSEIKGQRKGESKEDYVMRLLSRKKHLLGQLADIQDSEGGKKIDSVESKSIVKESGCDVVDSDEEDDASIDSVHNGQKSITTDQSEKIAFEKETKDVHHATALITDLSASATVSPSQVQTPTKRTSPASKSPVSTLWPLDAVSKVMEEWVTRDSLKFLGTGGKESASVNQPELDKKYGELCKMVADQEKDFDHLLGEVQMEGDKQASSPLPDFKQIQAETRDYELRVREFYRGSFGGQKKRMNDIDDIIQPSAESPRQKVQLPTVDSHDQMVIRRKIVLDRLDKVIPDLLPPLCLTLEDVAQHLRELVYTFSFTSHNILFKPGQWSLVAFILMKMLTLKSQKIQASFKEQSAMKYFSIILAGIGHTLSDLDQVVEWLACLNMDT
ncbi:putative RNA polymerase II subunit B1 CTD phosphatase RPAP2 [Haliotis asinina]|uniref:putative RNA polymerase II subunit B1 CTD phosphatase RPAP2 n=1 Tax=Haliotis asinina TaxID=109174 RepID=UPI003532078D